MKLKELNKMTTQFSRTERMPVLFLGHGSPMNAIQENEFVTGFRNIGATIPKPQAIMCVSAHWETQGTFVTAMEMPKTIHDFGSFPQELFDVRYPAPGSPTLARESKNLVKTVEVGLDEDWGLDHGSWSVVKHLYPNADVPVIQMSLDNRQTPQYHYDLAKQLASLRNKGVLIIGSGNMVHNLAMLDKNTLNAGEFGFDWAIEANERMKEFILSNNHQSLINFDTHGRAFDLAIPTPEHYLPLLYALALKSDDETVSVFNDKAIAGSMSMTSVKIGN